MSAAALGNIFPSTPSSRQSLPTRYIGVVLLTHDRAGRNATKEPLDRFDFPQSSGNESQEAGDAKTEEGGSGY